ncbi:MAG: hypothetical protein ACKV19_25955 [Verrucomicrobiales bacterium]
MVLTVASAVKRLFLHPRYQVMAVMVVVAFVLGDRLFPFSSFPMYGGFPDRTHYVYLADGDGNPLPMHDVFGYRTTKVKRIYSNEMRDSYKSLKAAAGEEDEVELHTMTADQLRPAGDATLQWLVANDRRRKQRQGAPLPPLQLYHVDVDVAPDGRLRRTARLVGTHPGGPS